MGDTSNRWAGCVLAALVIVAGLFEVHNLDIGLHARTGQWIVEHGEVPRVNVMSSIHADHPAVDDKWGFQVLAHVLFDGLGPNAVILARLLLMLALFGVMDASARRLGATPGTRLLLLTLALVAMRTRFMFRPGLVSLLLLAVTARVALVTRPDGRRAARVLLPLQLLWANVHGYFILGPLTALAVAAGHVVRGRAGWPTARRWILVGGGMALVCLVNPAGLEGALHPVAILRDLREHYDFYSANIVEFRGAFAPDPRGPWDRLAFWIVGALTAAALLARAWIDRPGRAPAGETALGRAHRVDLRGTPGPDATPGADADAAAPDGAPGPGADAAAPGWSPAITWPALALLSLLALQTVSLRRNMAPFAVVAAPLAAALLGDGARRWLGSGRAARPATLLLPTALAAVVAWGEASDTISIHDGLDRRWGLGLSSVAYPDAGIDFIAEHLPREGVWTEFGYGSTFTGRRWPEQVAATDGNTHGYPTSWLRSVIEASSGADPLAFDDLTRRHGLDVALIPMATPLSLGLVRRDDWVLVCVGREEAVFVRREARFVDGPREGGVRVEPEAWFARHDLEARLEAGDDIDWPSTPDPGSLLGLRRAVHPQAELDQALLLLSLDRPDLAAARAEVALRLAPDDPVGLGLAGLAAARRGRVDEARRRLQASLDAGVRGAVGQLVRQALQSLP